MKTPHLLVPLCALAATSACGPGVGPSDGSGSGSGSGGSTTTPVPLECSYGNDVYEDGDEFDTPDGCVRYLCDNGGLIPVVDNRITVAGDLDLPTQEEVDAQTCLSVVEGSLTISGTAGNLSPLGQLTRVGGNLEIVASNVATLRLETLAEIGGYITIADNANLELMGFQPWMSVFGDVTIQNNDRLTSLAGAEFIGQCTTCAAVGGSRGPGGIIGGEPSAASGDGGAEPAGDEGFDEPQGGTYYGGILIADNDVLTNITAMSNLWYAWDDVRFRNNAVLDTLSGLQLVEVQGDLEVTDHPLMPTVDVEAFAAVIEVWGETTICGNLDGTECPP